VLLVSFQTKFQFLVDDVSDLNEVAQAQAAGDFGGIPAGHLLDADFLVGGFFS
jgi:hypothetical protein